MDGLRKVPQNIPNQDLIKENLEKPLSSIPDPFGKFKSFSDHNNNKLIDFLKSFEFDFVFKSATEQYQSGDFNQGLEAIFDNYEKILNVIIPTLEKIEDKLIHLFCQFVNPLVKFYKLKSKS